MAVSALLRRQDLRCRRAQLEQVGAGFMIGSVLAVVLPEGFDAFHAAATAHVGAPEAPPHRHAAAEAGLDADAYGHELLADALGHGEDMHTHSHSGGAAAWAAGAAVLAGFCGMMLLEACQHQLNDCPGHRPQVRAPWTPTTVALPC